MTGIAGVFVFGFYALGEPPPAGADRTREYERLIDAIASRNKPPQMVSVSDAGSAADIVMKTRIPLFDEKYDFADQDRVRRTLWDVMQ